MKKIISINFIKRPQLEDWMHPIILPKNVFLKLVLNIRCSLGIQTISTTIKAKIMHDFLQRNKTNYADILAKIESEFKQTHEAKQMSEVIKNSEIKEKALKKYLKILLRLTSEIPQLQNLAKEAYLNICVKQLMNKKKFPYITSKNVTKIKKIDFNVSDANCFGFVLKLDWFLPEDLQNKKLQELAKQYLKCPSKDNDIPRIKNKFKGHKNLWNDIVAFKIFFESKGYRWTENPIKGKRMAVIFYGNIPTTKGNRIALLEKKGFIHAALSKGLVTGDKNEDVYLQKNGPMEMIHAPNNIVAGGFFGYPFLYFYYDG